VNITHHALAAKTAGDLGKRATATSWGSSGRRFKSCQPDTGQTHFPEFREVPFMPSVDACAADLADAARWFY
jgi:hypothetical protein